ncbi:hypothetical protein LMG3458_00843 [Achromobacter deleyi]|uniref:Uncharacterized protein n=1 Tax=Achromobacter deleyi TaxID=1353891 RepID=A0A6S6ZX65_9BURK|nr:hypothetical protein [Achromobacter deleyi]CAB3666014.1 hypothetical protein LMG3458_00843 [Achromobacter deleyi]CAB3833652.1 hypothetical protein LMG3482_00891 [Achromobacter deleyi]CAB3855247.1 hypothetical protein LMG3481_01970 [Achromobacter deleyi]CAB3880865.1 hypothetical protein LMG3412_03248 [Achromobacter deleyi]
MRNLDFSSWQAVLSTLLGLAVITLIGVGIRLLVMQTIQQRRERENRQINERLRTLIAAYKTLGGSFTGNLAVDPTHLRDLRRGAPVAQADLDADPDGIDAPGADLSGGDLPGGERRRRVRDAVEAALSDIILLGTEEQVRLAARAASDLTAGRSIQTAELVISLRDFIRGVLDLEPVPVGLEIPRQGPTRPAGTRGKSEGNARGEARGGGKGGGAGAGGGAAAGMGVGMGLGAGRTAEASHEAVDPVDPLDPHGARQ